MKTDLKSKKKKQLKTPNQKKQQKTLQQSTPPQSQSNSEFNFPLLNKNSFESSLKHK